MKKRNFLIIVFLLLSLFLISCKTKTEKFTIKYVITSNDTETIEYDLGTTVTLPKVNKEGYTFLGWYDNNRLIGKECTEYTGTKVEEVTFYALIITNEQNEHRLNLYKVQDLCKAIKKLSLNVKLSDKEEITSLRDTYNSLLDEYKEQVYNLSYLEQVEQKYQDLIDKLTYLGNIFDNEVMDLPINITLNYKDKVNELLDKYETFDDDLKSFIKKYDLLTLHKENIIKEESDTTTVSYVLGNSIFKSREELFNNIFTDLYYFLKDNAEENLFVDNKINNLDDFLHLASDYNAGRGQMRGLGDIFGWYFLQKDYNGILTNQPKDKFLGYCLKHNKYIDFINFYQMFFAYWRIDEKYANSSNAGADLFAEGWAALVDLCKYFYFNADTSYVKSLRVHELFTNPSSVIKEELQTKINGTLLLPTNLTLRGYRFLGWYDNPDFTGDKILEIKETGKKQIVYAKFEKTEESYIDMANLIDIYIDNLFTSKAVVTDVTKGYVITMYNELPDEYKVLVKKYYLLENL